MPKQSMSVLPLALTAGGAILIWAAITDRSPLQVFQNVLQGKAVPEKGSGSPKKDGENGGNGDKNKDDGIGVSPMPVIPGLPLPMFPGSSRGGSDPPQAT